MKKISIIYGILLFTLAFFACTSESEKNEKAEEEKEKAKMEQLKEMNLKMQKELAEEIAEFKEETADQIAENNRAIENLRESIKKEGKKIQEIQTQRILELEKINDALKVKMAEFREESKENWEQFKEAFEKEMEVLKQDLKDFAKKDEQ